MFVRVTIAPGVSVSQILAPVCLLEVEELIPGTLCNSHKPTQYWSGGVYMHVCFQHQIHSMLADIGVTFSIFVTSVIPVD